jgi:hypothetical protein
VHTGDRRRRRSSCRQCRPRRRASQYQGNGSTYEEISLPFAGIAANTWQHVVLTRVASTKTIQVYVNGVLKQTRTYTGTVVAGTRPISIGRSDSGSKHVNGRLDEVAVYASALSAGRIASHYAQRLANGSATTVSLQMSAVDPDGDAMAYGATGLPASLSIDPNTGLISGTVTASSVGSHTVTVVASDGSLSHSRTFTWTVQQ